jgi:antitoxin MazE
MVRARVGRWGNSRGSRIPRPMPEQAGITADDTLEVRDGEIVIRPATPHPRTGWAESYRQRVADGHAEPLWPDPMSDRFDDELPPW